MLREVLRQSELLEPSSALSHFLRRSADLATPPLILSAPPKRRPCIPQDPGIFVGSKDFFAYALHIILTWIGKVGKRPFVPYCFLRF